MRFSASARFSHSRCNMLRGRGGFTLIEILIVGALIALFAGLAIYNMQRFFDDTKNKAMYDETKQVGTAAAFAEQDVGFFPRLNVLTLPRTLVTTTANVSGTNITICRPAMDAYGALPEYSPFTSAVAEKWQGNYLGASEARVRLSQGSKALVAMRLPERSSYQGAWNTRGIDVTLAQNWPADTWGNPYVVYLCVADTNVTALNPANKVGVRLINRPGEFANYFCAVVSYGPNRVPGGAPQAFFESDASAADKNRATTWINNNKIARLYVDNDLISPGVAAYTLRSATSSVAAASINDASFQAALPNSITNQAAPGDLAQPGIRDPGSDDIVWTF